MSRKELTQVCVGPGSFVNSDHRCQMLWAIRIPASFCVRCMGHRYSTHDIMYKNLGHRNLAPHFAKPPGPPPHPVTSEIHNGHIEFIRCLCGWSRKLFRKWTIEGVTWAGFLGLRLWLSQVHLSSLSCICCCTDSENKGEMMVMSVLMIACQKVILLGKHTRCRGAVLVLDCTWLLGSQDKYLPGHKFACGVNVLVIMFSGMHNCQVSLALFVVLLEHELCVTRLPGIS